MIFTFGKSDWSKPTETSQEGIPIGTTYFIKIFFNFLADSTGETAEAYIWIKVSAGDGGDQANAVLTFLLVPLTLVDGRRWHWQKSTDKTPNQTRNSFSWAVVVLIRIQVSVIYLHAAVAKFQVHEWVNGTATYYWFTHHYHGAAGYLKPMIVFIVSNSVMVVLISWGTIALELLLFSAIIMPPESWRRKSLLVAGLVFHFLIVIVHGLRSFYFTMAAALLLYLLDYKVSLDFKKSKSKKIWIPS